MSFAVLRNRHLHVFSKEDISKGPRGKRITRENEIFGGLDVEDVNERNWDKWIFVYPGAAMEVICS